MKLQLPIQLTPKQKEIDASTARFKIIKGGRRGGKSKYGAFWSLRNTLVNPGMHWYLAKSLSLIREEIWPTVMSMVPQDRIVRVDTRLFYITVLGNGGKESTLAFKSAEHPDNLRGRGLKSLAIDEASFVYQHLFNVILRPMLADHMAPALMFSSPKVGWFTNTWKDAEDGKLKDWAAFYLTIMDNPHIDSDEIAAIKASTPPDVWEQEYMAKESAGVGIVMPEFTDDSIVRAHVKYPGFRRWKCGVGIDWGYDDDTAAIWAHVTTEGHILFSAEHCQNNWDVSKHCAVIRKKNVYLERQPTAYELDSSAWRSHAGERSIGEQFRKNGFQCGKATTALGTSLDHFKRFLRGGSESWIKIDQSCPKLIQGLREWEHGKHEPDAVAAARYILNKIVTMKWTPLADVRPVYVHSENLDFDTNPVANKMNVSMFKAPISTSWNFDDGVPG